MGTGDLHAVLGVSPEATQAGDQASLVPKVREHPPERIRTASRGLPEPMRSPDPKRRVGYDPRSSDDDVVRVGR